MKTAALVLAVAGSSFSDWKQGTRFVDLDADGRLDLVRLVEGRLSVTWNLGGRSLRPATDLPDVDARALLVEDLDGDSRPDLYLVADGPNRALVSSGTRGFVDATRELGLEDPGPGRDVRSLDLDGDGARDVVLHNAEGSVIFWGLPGGGFERDASLPPVPFVPRPTAVVGPPAPTPSAAESKERGRAGERASGPDARTARPVARAPGTRRPVDPGPPLAAGAPGDPDLPAGSLLLWESPVPPPGFDLSHLTIQVDQVEGWGPGTDVSVNHFGAASATVGGKLYVLGGLDQQNYTTVVEVYDPVARTWTSLNPMPAPALYSGVGVVGGKIYVCGGNSTVGNTTDVWEYDPATDSWTQKASMLTAQVAPGSGAVDGKIYLIGGYDTTELDIVQEYDVASDTWSIKPSTLPVARFRPGSAVIGGKIVVAGGRIGLGDANDVDIYDPSTDSFSPGAPMLTPGSAGRTVRFQGEVVVMCPFDGNYSSRVEAYDPVLDSWRVLPNTPNVHYFGCAQVLGQQIHILGGVDGPTFITSHDIYVPSAPALQVIRKNGE